MHSHPGFPIFSQKPITMLERNEKITKTRGKGREVRPKRYPKIIQFPKRVCHDVYIVYKIPRSPCVLKQTQTCVDESGRTSYREPLEQGGGIVLTEFLISIICETNSQESNFPNCLENRIVSISYRHGEAGDGDWECGVSVKCTTPEYNTRNNLLIYLILLGGKSTTVGGLGAGGKGSNQYF